MSRPRRLLFGTLGALALGLLGVYLAGKVEPYSETVKRGPAPEARADVYLAAEHFLRRLDIPVQRADALPGLEALPPEGRSLLLLGDHSGLGTARTGQLLDWVARGGHLLFIAEKRWDASPGKRGDRLLDGLGLRQRLTEAPKPSADDSEASTSDLTRLYLPGEDAPAYLRFDDQFALQDPAQRAHLQAASARATHLLQLAHGRGRVTVLTDGDLWTNAQISELDHAWLLWYLTQGTTVTLVGRTEAPALPMLLARHFPEALFALTLLLGLTLWRAGQRRGPVLPARAAGVRQLQTHVRGLAEFHLRHDGRPGLVARLQDDVRQQAQTRHPGFADLPVADQQRLLARLSRQPLAFIQRAMQPPFRLSTAEFTDQVAHLQTLRNAL